MTTLFDSVTWGSTSIMATVGDWTRAVNDMDLGVIEWTQYTVPAPWVGGDQVLGTPRAFGRRFSLTISSTFDGSATNVQGAHYDEIEALNALFTPGVAATVELKTTRKNTANSTVSRSIYCYCTHAYPLAFINDRGASGLWILPDAVRGRINYRVELYAPWPFWVDTTENSQAITTGTGVTNSGVVATGAKITLSAKSGTVTSLAMANDRNAYTTTFTNPADAQYADWGHTDPSGATLSGTIGATDWFRLETGANSLTKTVAGGGTMVSTVTWRNNWATP